MAKKRENKRSAPEWNYSKVKDADEGIVEHIITLFGVIDYGLDRSHPGSFSKTLAERSPRKIRVLDQHNTDSVKSIVGKPIKVEELTRAKLPKQIQEDFPEATGGVMATTQFFLDTEEGKGVFIRVKEDTVEWSYGYDALDYDTEDVKHKGKEVEIRNLRSIKLYEYSPVLFGMVPGTTTLSAKDHSPVVADDEKPAPDVTENTIRIRVRNPKDFDEETFKVIPIGAEDSGIQATAGKLADADDNAMVIQSYIFDKEKFDTASAQAWVDEHEKDYIACCTKLRKLTDEEKERFWEKVNKTDDGCWLWTGGKDQDGYGIFTIDGSSIRAHRLSYIMAKGSIPEGKIICHKCEDANPSCVRPAHLVVCDHSENNTPGKTLDQKRVDFTKLVRRVQDAFSAQFNPVDEPWRHWVNTVYDDSVIAQVEDDEGGRKWFLISYSISADDDEISFASREEWIPGDYTFTPETAKAAPESVVVAAVLLSDLTRHVAADSWEAAAINATIANLRFEYGEDITAEDVAELEAKAGRVLAGRNAARIGDALTTLVEVLTDAGIAIPGLTAEEEEGEPLDEVILALEIQQAELGLLEIS